jgi:hypothetical protein
MCKYVCVNMCEQVCVGKYMCKYMCGGACVRKYVWVKCMQGCHKGVARVSQGFDNSGTMTG